MGLKIILNKTVKSIVNLQASKSFSDLNVFFRRQVLITHLSPADLLFQYQPSPTSVLGSCVFLVVSPKPVHFIFTGHHVKQNPAAAKGI